MSSTFYEQLFCQYSFAKKLFIIKPSCNKSKALKSALVQKSRKENVGVNFTNILHAAFARADPEIAKKD